MNDQHGATGVSAGGRWAAGRVAAPTNHYMPCFHSYASQLDLMGCAARGARRSGAESAPS